MSVHCPLCKEELPNAKARHAHIMKKHKNHPKKHKNHPKRKSLLSCKVCKQTGFSESGVKLHTQTMHPLEEMGLITKKKKHRRRRKARKIEVPSNVLQIPINDLIDQNQLKKMLEKPIKQALQNMLKNITF